MVPSLSPQMNQFLNGLSRLQATITKATEQLTSGHRIGQASDAPDQISPLLGLLADVNHNEAVTRTLTTVQADVQGADQAVSTALELLTQARTLAVQGANSTSTAATRATLAQQVAAIQQQLVALANTQVAGRYVFAGDQYTSQPYSLQLTQPVQVGQGAAALIEPTDTAVFNIQTVTGPHTVIITGQTGDSLTGQMSELNSQLQGLGIAASFDANNKLQFVSENAFSVSAQATGHASLVNNTSPETANNTGLNSFQYFPQAGGGNHVMITVGGISAIATLANPASITSTDVNAINDALAAQGLTGVTAVLDQTAPNAISFQGFAGFSISDDHATAGNYAFVGNSAAATFPANGVARLSNTPMAVTRRIEMADQSFTTVDQTAQDLFDHRNPSDTLAGDNVFAALNSLRTALENPNQLNEQGVEAAVRSALSSVKSATDYLNARQGFFGASQNRITSAQNQINSENANLQQRISAIRDTDVVATALQLTSAETEQQAALSAAAKLPRTTLFDFLA